MQEKHILTKPFRSLTPSATLEINEKSAALEAQNQRPIKLGLGQSPFPVPEDLVAALAASAHEKDYLPVQGLRSLRDSIAQWHQRKHRLQFCADDIVIGPGSKELLFLLQLVTDTQTFLPTPSWVSYGPQRTMLGERVTWIPGHKPLAAGISEATSSEDTDCTSSEISVALLFSKRSYRFPKP